MPDWSDLTAQLADSAQVPITLGGPEVATRFERLFGRVGLIEAIRRALHPDVAAPGDAHMALTRLPFDTIYTTNFDLLLEHALERVRKPYRSLVGELQMPFHAGRLTTNIVKMHGDIRHEEHMVATTEDYARFLETYPVMATHLSAMLITRTALFLGYSRSDPDFQHIASVVKSRLGRFQRMSYMIQFDSSPEDFERGLDDQLHIIRLNAPYVERNVFHTVERPHRLVYASTTEWPDGSHVESLMEISLQWLDGRTLLTLTQRGLPSGEAERGFTEGWNEFLDGFVARIRARSAT
jgi:hypothetical protein